MSTLKEAVAAGVPFRKLFEPGMYELCYDFIAPGFDPESTYRLFDGRRTGPWDYAPWGTPGDGDCLLPCVTLSASCGPEVRARVFVPRKEELDRRYFNGRVGFRVTGPEEVELELAASLPVDWGKIELCKVERFSAASLGAIRPDPAERFFLSDDALALIRKNWGKSTASRLIDRVLDDCAKFDPPEKLSDARRVITKFLKTEQLYEDDVIFWGDYLAALSLRLLVSDREEDLRQLVKWTDALTRVAVWGDSDDPKGRDHNNDLTADFHMLGLVIALNWHGRRFSAGLVDRIKAKIDYQAGEMLKWIVGCRSSWPGVNTQNHAYFGYQTLVLAGAALLGDERYSDRASDYLGIGAAAFRRFVDHLPGDGSYHEGIGYIAFGLHGLLPSLFLLQQLTGEPWIPEQWLAAHFRAMNRLAPEHCGEGFFIDDGHGCFPCCPQAAMWGWKHAATESARHDAAQLLGKFLRHRRETGHDSLRFGMDFWALVMAPEICDPEAELPEIEPDDPAPELLDAAGYFFEDLAKDVRVYFLSAPPHGHEQFPHERHTYGYGHHHPDTGSVLLLDHGRWILADTGYTVCKASSEHCVLLVDGRGQYNDNHVWLAPPPWDIPVERAKMEQQGGATRVSGNFSYIYPPESGLRLWRRQLTLREGVLLVEDEVELAHPAIPSLSWISEFEWTANGVSGAANAGGWTVEFSGDAGKIAVEPVHPARRSPEGEAKVWHALRVAAERPVRSFRCAACFRRSQEAVR